MPLVSISAETKLMLDQITKLDKRTQGLAIAFMCEQRLQELNPSITTSQCDADIARASRAKSLAAIEARVNAEAAKEEAKEALRLEKEEAKEALRLKIKDEKESQRADRAKQKAIITEEKEKQRAAKKQAKIDAQTAANKEIEDKCRRDLAELNKKIKDESIAKQNKAINDQVIADAEALRAKKQAEI